MKTALFLLKIVGQRRNRSRQPIKNCAHTGCERDQKVLQVGQKLSEVAHSFIKHRGVKKIHLSIKRRRRQLFPRNALAFIEKAFAVKIHRGVSIKHRGEKRRKRQLFSRNALAFIEKAVVVIIHHGILIKHCGEKRRKRQPFRRNAHQFKIHRGVKTEIEPSCREKDH